MSNAQVVLHAAICIVGFMIGWKSGGVVKMQGGGESAFLGRLIAGIIVAALADAGATKLFGL